MELRWDFRDGKQGWEAGFADYPQGEDAFYELASGLAPLPPGIHPPGQGYLLSGSNHSDCLFMFLRRRLTTEDGLQPGKAYKLSCEIRFASNAASRGGVGAGGDPGNSVYVKLGAVNERPAPVPHTDGNWRMNVDIGSQSQGGADAVVVGTIANGENANQHSPGQIPYRSVCLSHGLEKAVTLGPSGELWILIRNRFRLRGEDDPLLRRHRHYPRRGRAQPALTLRQALIQRRKKHLPYPSGPFSLSPSGFWLPSSKQPTRTNPTESATKATMGVLKTCATRAFAWGFQGKLN